MDIDKIKEFFVYNFEKMILVVVIGVSVFLIYSGSQQPIFTTDHDPEDLKADANQVKSDIDLDHNEKVLSLHLENGNISNFDIVAATVRSATPVDQSSYEPPKKWVASSESGQTIRRKDPLLLPPAHLVLHSIASMISIQADNKDESYPLFELEGADPVEKVEKPKRRERRSRNRNAGDGEDMEEMGMEEDMMEQMGGDLGGLGGLGDMGAESGAGGSTRKFDKKFDFGYRPSENGETSPIPTFGRFIAGTAVVPFKKIYDQYSLALSDSRGYKPGRDTPMFCDMQVRRADVTDKSVDELVDADWVELIWNRKLLTLLAAKKWAGFAPEIVPEDYRDDALSLWLPPVLLDDYRRFASHPMIPMLSRSDIKRQQDSQIGEGQKADSFTIDGNENIELKAPGSQEDSNSGSMSDTMGTGGMDGMMDMSDMEGMGMGMGMGMAMMGRGLDADPPTYKLVRFYDFYSKEMYNLKDDKSPQLGRRYVYSIRYAVDDPNFPRFAAMQPQLSTLDPDVANRIQGMMESVKTVDQRTEMSKKWSEWSEPSAPTSLPSTEQYFTGPVKSGTVNMWMVANKEVPYVRDLPKTSMMTCYFDSAVDAKVPLRAELFEGAVLSGKAEQADVVDPITMEVKKLPNVEMVSSTTIVDIDGGTPLKITENLTEPGMVLLFDQDGTLHLNDEVSDLEMFRIHSYADERGE